MPRNKAKTSTSGRGPTTQAAYEKLVDSHRAQLGNHTEAAKVAGVSYNTAMRAFREGLGKNKPAIRTIMSREMAETRAQLQQYRDVGDDTREITQQAAKDVAMSRGMQGRSLRMARNNAIASMALSSNLLRSGVLLSAKVELLLSDPAWVPKPREAVGLLRSITEIARNSIEMAHVTDQMESRILGQPDLVVGHMEMTPDQAVVALQEGARTLERLQRRAARGDLPEGVSMSILDVEEI